MSALLHPIRWWRRRHHAKQGWVSEAERERWAFFWDDHDRTLTPWHRLLSPRPGWWDEDQHTP